MPLPALAPLLGELLPMLGVRLGAAELAGVTARGAGVLESAGLTNARSITGALGGGVGATAAGVAPSIAGIPGIAAPTRGAAAGAKPIVLGSLEDDLSKLAQAVKAEGAHIKDVTDEGAAWMARKRAEKEALERQEQEARQKTIVQFTTLAAVIGLAASKISGSLKGHGVASQIVGMPGETLGSIPLIGGLLKTLHDLSPGIIHAKIGARLFDFGLALADAAKKARDWGESVFAAAEPLRKFSGIIATSFAQQERQQLILGFRTAQATGGSTALLGRQIMALREDTQPMREAMINVKNVLAAGILRALRLGNAIFNKMPPVVVFKTLAEALNKLFGGGAQPPAVGTFLQGIASGAYRGAKHVPPKRDPKP